MNEPFKGQKRRIAAQRAFAASTREGVNDVDTDVIGDMKRRTGPLLPIEDDLLQGLMRRKQQDTKQLAIPTAALLESSLRILGMKEDADLVRGMGMKIAAYEPNFKVEDLK